MFTATYPVEIFNEICSKISAVRANHESHEKIPFGFFSSPLRPHSAHGSAAWPISVPNRPCPSVLLQGRGSPAARSGPSRVLTAPP